MLASDPTDVPTFEREEYCCPFCCSNPILSFKHEHRDGPWRLKLFDWILHADA